jgi:ABC-type transport system involved in multi-copper enzyme maturation permease subunit
MSIATALAVIFLASSQLPREFDKRTIYPLLAKPISRFQFILGKFFGVVFAGIFCYFLFSIILLIGILYIKTQINLVLYIQNFYLVILMIGIIASLAFVLSLIAHQDAAITILALLFFLAQIYMTTLSYLYDYVSDFGKLILKIMNYIIPQISLFDLSAKLVHYEVWGPIASWAMIELTIYAFVYIFIFLGLSYFLFKKRPI